jgi:hypothetical protein
MVKVLGVDIIVKQDDKLITLQCKREIKSGSLKDVNHFIRGSQIIKKKENIKPKLFCCLIWNFDTFL